MSNLTIGSTAKFRLRPNQLSQNQARGSKTQKCIYVSSDKTGMVLNMKNWKEEIEIEWVLPHYILKNIVRDCIVKKEMEVKKQGKTNKWREKHGNKHRD